MEVRKEVKGGAQSKQSSFVRLSAIIQHTTQKVTITICKYTHTKLNGWSVHISQIFSVSSASQIHAQKLTFEKKNGGVCGAVLFPMGTPHVRKWEAEILMMEFE